MPAYDVTFGVAHTIISLGITILIGRYVNNIWTHMFLNAVVFSSMIFIVAIELKLAFGLPFLETWLFTAIGEFVVMIIGMPIMYFIQKRVHFERMI